MLLVTLVSNNLSNYGRRHLELFTNCHVSWDTLYQIPTCYRVVSFKMFKTGAVQTNCKIKLVLGGGEVGRRGILG